MNLVKTIVPAVLLAGHGFLLQYLSNSPRTPLAEPLSAIPQTLGKGARLWNAIREGELTPQEAQTLQADSVLIRTYQGPTPEAHPVTLLVAYFEAQVEGRSPHSPKNCLPGSGWEPVESSRIEVAVGDATERIPVNRYLLAKDEGRVLMLYWYQSGRRAVASEYAAKIFLVRDALLERKTENAIVRLSVPLRHAADQQSETDALELIGSLYPAVRTKLSHSN